MNIVNYDIHRIRRPVSAPPAVAVNRIVEEVVADGKIGKGLVQAVAATGQQLVDLIERLIGVVRDLLQHLGQDTTVLFEEHREDYSPIFPAPILFGSKKGIGRVR